MADRLIVRGAREHNLKDIHLDLPRDALIVFTGLSGSGKSSLAFDTIVAEGQRRYVESLSAYARQFLGQMDKPDVDFIEGLSPAVSIDQKSTSRNPRSTVGTITEVYDYLRLLAARATAKQRLTDSIETALGLGGGLVILEFVDRSPGDPERERTFSEHLACLYDDLSFDELEPRSFSFNSPYGACPTCTGLGTKLEADPELIVPDPTKTLAQGAVGPWGGAHGRDYFGRLLEALGIELGFNMHTPWERLPSK